MRHAKSALHSASSVTVGQYRYSVQCVGEILVARVREEGEESAKLKARYSEEKEETERGREEDD